MKNYLKLKKGLMFVFLFIIIFSFVGFVIAGDVAYIFKSKGKIDNNVVNVFKEMNLTVDLIDEKKLPSDFSNYKIVYVGDERFRNKNKIKIGEFPVIISNYFFGEDWGLTDRDGISKLVANSPLQVRIGNRIIQVYTRATFGGSVGIPYYYLADGNRDEDLEKIASPYLNNGDDLGAVISHGSPGIRLSNGKLVEDNICFFGIIESDYWTNDAKDLFKECVEFVGVECKSDNDCADDETSAPYCVGKKVFKNITSFQCENPGTVQSQCTDSLTSVFVKECSSACSNGACICLDKDNDGFDECNIGEDGDDGKQVDCDDNNPNVNPWAVEVCNGIDDDCDGVIDEGSDICNIGSVCHLGTCMEIECSSDSDCGTDGFAGNNFCQQGDAYRNFNNYTCLNPGTISSECKLETSSVLVDDCNSNELCSNGQCVAITIVCDEDIDCDDNNHLTFDQCLNPGTPSSSCQNTIINCAFDSDCGQDGFTGDNFCGEGNVHKNFTDYTCLNPGTTSSSCKVETTSVVVEDCNGNEICSNGMCIAIGVHDVGFANFTNSVNNIKIEHENGTLVSNNELICNNKYKIKIKVENFGDFVENVTFDGSVGNIGFNHFKVDNLAPGATSPERTRTVNVSLAEGNYDVIVNANIPVDDDSANNQAKRNVDVICPFIGNIICEDDSDCGQDGFTGDNFCGEGNVHKNFTDYTCLNPGTTSSSCKVETTSVVVEDCNGNEICSNGMCVAIECSQDSDCGIDGFTGDSFCKQGDVFRDFIDYTCLNQGTEQSSCNSSVNSILVEECNSNEVCSSGMCLYEGEACFNVVIYRQEDYPELDDTASFFNRNGVRIHNQPQIADRWIILSKNILIGAGTNHYLKRLNYFGRGNDKNSQHRFEAYVRDRKNENIRHILIEDNLEDEQRHFVFEFSRRARKIFWPKGTRLGQYGDLTATFCKR